ncbi:MAG: tRNA pseudouridine(38-40) synthase TruA [Alphaproteobacteria bacterium]|nr:tRNA pseudouridine(38-40) synthase TruA [Alphaproteobacteria bacterium]
MTQRWKLTMEYDGASFLGWQRQREGLTVQGCLEEAVFRFSGERVTAHVAGRTDAGVHALGQVAHIDIEKDVSAKTVRDAINFHMHPHPVSVVEAAAVTDDFHARFSAIQRTYCYKIIMARGAVPAVGGQYAWHIWKDLDIDAMNEGAKYLLGLHDFSSFRAAECQAKSPMRSMDRLEFIEKQDEPAFGRHIELWAEAKSFLHHQIRNIVGTLKLVGEEKWRPIDIKHALEACDRTKAGQTAPPHGLFFVKVKYPSLQDT